MPASGFTHLDTNSTCTLLDSATALTELSNFAAAEHGEKHHLSGSESDSGGKWNHILEQSLPLQINGIAVELKFHHPFQID
jgi:hypothetical protein